MRLWRRANWILPAILCLTLIFGLRIATPEIARPPGYETRAGASEGTQSQPNVDSATATGTASVNPTATTNMAPAFSGTIQLVGDQQQSAMLSTGSWRPGCPVPVSALRVLDVSYFGFDGAVHRGEIMVNADVANSILTVFHGLFDAHFPIRRMQLVEEFGANDEASMQADNTSGFNCRGIPGASSWSEHAYGRAIDVNPLENPEIRNGHIDPPTAARFADRSLNAQGMIHQGDVAVLETQPKSLAGLADM